VDTERNDTRVVVDDVDDDVDVDVDVDDAWGSTTATKAPSGERAATKRRSLLLLSSSSSSSSSFLLSIIRVG
jgi:hypothetical protein